MANRIGQLFHQQRLVIGGWQTTFDRVGESVSDGPPSFGAVSCGAVSDVLHLVGVGTDGFLYHCLRIASGAWQASFGLIESQVAGGPVGFVRVGCAGVADALQLVGVGVDGHLYHTIRNADGTWQASFGDVAVAVGGGPGTYLAVGCAGVGTDLQLVALGADGELYHTIRHQNGSWQPNFELVQSVVAGGPPGLVGIACAGVGTAMQLLALGSDGKLYHTIRDAGAGWQTPFGDVAQAVGGGPPAFADVGCGGVGDSLQVVGLGVDGLVHLAIREADGSWQGNFGALANTYSQVAFCNTQSTGPPQLHAVACAGTTLSLQVVASAGVMVRKFTYLYDVLEVTGTVVGPFDVNSDELYLQVDPGFESLVASVSGSGGNLKCETYPEGISVPGADGSNQINHMVPFTSLSTGTYTAKPAGVPFEGLDASGYVRPLQVGDRVRLRGRLLVENGHPQPPINPAGFGEAFLELHPFDYQTILFDPIPTLAGAVRSHLLFMLAPLYEAITVQEIPSLEYSNQCDHQAFVSSSHFGQPPERWHSVVSTDVLFEATQLPAGAAGTLQYTETIVANSSGLALDQIRTVSVEATGIRVRAQVQARANLLADGVLIASPDGLTQTPPSGVFIARYEVYWEPQKNAKDTKDSKETTDAKPQKDNKDHKDNKDKKDVPDVKGSKDNLSKVGAAEAGSLRLHGTSRASASPSTSAGPVRHFIPETLRPDISRPPAPPGDASAS